MTEKERYLIVWASRWNAGDRHLDMCNNSCILVDFFILVNSKGTRRYDAGVAPCPLGYQKSLSNCHIKPMVSQIRSVVQDRKLANSKLALSTKA